MTTHDHPTRKVLGKDLDSTMTLVGESGGLSSIYEIGPAQSMPGFVRAETEHGPLYLDPDEAQDVLTQPAEGDTRRTLTVEAVVSAYVNETWRYRVAPDWTAERLHQLMYDSGQDVIEVLNNDELVEYVTTEDEAYDEHDRDIKSMSLDGDDVPVPDPDCDPDEEEYDHSRAKEDARNEALTEDDE